MTRIPLGRKKDELAIDAILQRKIQERGITVDLDDQTLIVENTYNLFVTFMQDKNYAKRVAVVRHVGLNSFTNAMLDGFFDRKIDLISGAQLTDNPVAQLLESLLLPREVIDHIPTGTFRQDSKLQKLQLKEDRGDRSWDTRK